MIVDGGTIDFSWKCHNINISMGEYVLNCPMIAILLGGADVVLGSNGYNHWEQWILIFRTFSLNFHGNEKNMS